MPLGFFVSQIERIRPAFDGGVVSQRQFMSKALSLLVERGALNGVGSHVSNGTQQAHVVFMNEVCLPNPQHPDRFFTGNKRYTCHRHDFFEQVTPGKMGIVVHLVVQVRSAVQHDRLADTLSQCEMIASSIREYAYCQLHNQPAAGAVTQNKGCSVSFHQG